MTALKKAIVERLLESGNIYEVGGCVRDQLLGIGVSEKDRDYLVTQIPIDDLVDILRKFGRVDLVGKSFGVIKFTAHNNGSGPYPAVDIALPRREFSTGAAHRDFSVDFDHTLPVEEDLKRRDFTINAVARDLGTGELIDPLDGRIDIEHKNLRMISEESFKDDPLRILRGVQFVARFDLQIESATYQAMKENAHLMTSVSPERVNEELNKMLVRAEKPSVGFRLMHDVGLLEILIPELVESVGVDQPGGYHAHDVFEHLLKTTDAAEPRLRLRWAALLHDITKPRAKRVVDSKATFYGHEASGARLARNVLKRLRYPKHLIDDVSTLVERHMFTIPPTDKGLRRLIRKTGPELIFDLLDLRRADVVGQGMGNPTDDVDEFEQRIREEIDKKPPFSVRDLAIDGNDIMEEFDLEQSPLIGEILDHLLEIVLDEPELNKREVLIDAVKEYLQSEESR